MRWWAGRVRQFRSHLGARVAPAERTALLGWAPAWAVDAFDAMHVADRRHGLDVMASLLADGVDLASEPDRELLLAGLLHDCAKGDSGVWPRVAVALGQAYGPPVRRLGRLLPWPGWRTALDRVEAHAEMSARLVAAAGGSVRTVELIRHQDAPQDPIDGERLRLADEAN